MSLWPLMAALYQSEAMELIKDLIVGVLEFYWLFFSFWREVEEVQLCCHSCKLCTVKVEVFNRTRDAAV